MTSRIEALGTNEFLRRRKLRLQQVREQSKEIAKKIRQRAQVEKLRHLDDIDAKKKEEYFDCQEKLVKHLEHLYTQRIQNVGDSHKNALEVGHEVNVQKEDISKLRGIEAVAELRRQKQEKLDEQKKLLDRKLQAREAANEISREKSTSIAKSFARHVTNKDLQSKPANIVNLCNKTDINPIQDTNNYNLDTKKNDMGTQWESEELPNEWEPNVPTLSLPKDDSVKDSLNTEKIDKSKRLNLFALSEEMPSSLRGGTGILDDIVPNKPSLTLISEYLQNRNLRLRQTEPTTSNKPEDLQSIKQTILRTRTTRTDASKDKSSQSSERNTGISRKKSIPVYNHITRNTHDIPCDNEKLVSRDDKSADDAYAHALKETTVAGTLEKDNFSKLQKDMRTKVAVTKNNVDKEYKDTLAFLNSLTSDKCNKPIKMAYMDDHRQQSQNAKHQKKMQEEFKKIEQDCYRPNCKSKRKTTIFDKRYESPLPREQPRRDFEYSWMPVPESDGSLAIHTIPSTKNKSANTVKFCESDNYHEYRSRHKHTPPTKDVSNDRQKKRIVETVILQQTNNDFDINELSVTSETSSNDNFNIETDKGEDSKLKDAERIIIYKILESKKEKKSKDRKKVRESKPTKYTNADKTQVKTMVEDEQQIRNQEKCANDLQRGISFEQLQEGVYEAVSSNGDNIASMYFNEDLKLNDDKKQTQTCDKINTKCCCNKKEDVHSNDGNTPERPLNQASNCKCKLRNNESSHLIHPSAATSTTSFTTACNDKSNNRTSGRRFVRLVDEDAQENSKFYIGASGFLKDDNYEVIIQLRKKEAEKVNTVNDTTKSVSQRNPIEIKNKDQLLPDANANEQSMSPIKVATNVETVIAVHDFQHTSEHSVVKDNKIEAINPELKSHLNSMSEKAVHTSFQDTFAVPANVPKSDPVSRPATSAYTQTSFNTTTTTPKPIFMHMSSSTSTAYMSPPDLILPKFLKQNYIMTSENGYGSENGTNHVDCNFKIFENGNHIEFNDRKCRVCEINQLKTPPNTARSSSKEKSNVHYVKTKKERCKCHKCRSHSERNIYLRSHRKKSHSTLKTRSSRDLPSDYFKPIFEQTTKKKMSDTHSHTKVNNINLNPVVRNYVNRLLDINSVGLKTIEIINQNCSAPTTPSSSVINISCNRNNNKPTVEKKISLEQIKNILKQQILDNMIQKEKIQKATLKSKQSQTEKVSKISIKLPRKKSVHKVKSLNISKNILKKSKPSEFVIRSHPGKKPGGSTCSSVRLESKFLNTNKQDRSGSKTSTISRTYNSEYKNSTSSDIVETKNKKSYCSTSGKNIKMFRNKAFKTTINMNSQLNQKFNLSSHRTTMSTSFSSGSDASAAILTRLPPSQPRLHISTQTNSNIDPEINFMKIAEDKLHNMEKIADLTEKCTKRLSNLAKVLEEVRRNKSLVYSQISTSDSTPESESKVNKNEISCEISEQVSDPIILYDNKELIENVTSISMPEKITNENANTKKSAEFAPFLKDIPKPKNFAKAQTCSNLNDIPNNSTKALIEFETSTKNTRRPPPALSRIHLKYGQEVNIVPHELSTVIEVDSPMSMRLKNQTSRQDTKIETSEETDHTIDEIVKRNTIVDDPTHCKENKVNPDLLESNINLSRRMSKVSSTDSSDNSKARMMDMKKFNDIMLKPFISLKEYAHQCNIGLDEGSNTDDVVKGEAINDDLSSLHSDGSLPDVIAELLKRNIISEPFKFDTGSNVNSTTLSSESTLSILALSKARKEKNKTGMLLKNKEHTGETSETQSISSNPDLENAFQKLGMGWASSTLKKTKERLALSSSSNTSSSSMTQFKLKSFNQDVPSIAIDSTSSLDLSKKRERKRSSPGIYNIERMSKNVVQQTSLTNSMTVKEFLTNELANKITFNNKTSRKEAEDEFVSLYETKMPEEMKFTNVRSDQLSVISANHNRARTSTPVQIFKSQTYQSSSTSNTSNGFFSNADDLSSVKVTSNSIRNHSTSDKDDLTIPNYSLKTKNGVSDCSKSD